MLRRTSVAAVLLPSPWRSRPRGTSAHNPPARQRRRPASRAASPAAAALTPASSPEALGFDSQRLAKLDAYMAKAVADGRVAGMSTLLARHGQVVSEKTYGVKSLATGAPLTRDTIFRLYSMSKPITGVAMMMLFEDGQMAAGRSDHEVRARVQGAEGHERHRCERSPVHPGHEAPADDARADEPYGGIRLRPRRPASGRQALSRKGRARRQRAGGHDQADRGDSADVPAGNAVVVFLRRRHPGLHRREAVGPEVRRLPPAADLQAAEDDGHGVLRARATRRAASRRCMPATRRPARSKK